MIANYMNKRFNGGMGAKPGSAKSGGDFANLDFLPGQAISLVNLQPDEQGIVTIKREDLGTNCKLHVLAVDPTSAVLRTVSLPEIDSPAPASGPPVSGPDANPESDANPKPHGKGEPHEGPDALVTGATA